MIGICGCRCIKEQYQCQCFSLWRRSGLDCRWESRSFTIHYSSMSQDNGKTPFSVYLSSIFASESRFLWRLLMHMFISYQSLIGDISSATKTFHNYYSVWRQFGGLPEFYSIPQGYTVDKREGYPLRPGLYNTHCTRATRAGKVLKP